MATADKVYVKMEDGLSGAGADVENGAVTVLDFARTGDICSNEMAASDEFGIGQFSFFQSREMFLGHDEDVRGRLRIDVFEGEDMFVFVHFFRRDFSSNDAAEDAIGIVHESALR